MMERDYLKEVFMCESKTINTEVAQKACIMAKEEMKEIALKNFREVCGCYHAGTCTVDCKECALDNCETLMDLFNE